MNNSANHALENSSTPNNLVFSRVVKSQIRPDSIIKVETESGSHYTFEVHKMSEKDIDMKVTEAINKKGERNRFENRVGTLKGGFIHGERVILEGLEGGLEGVSTSPIKNIECSNVLIEENTNQLIGTLENFEEATQNEIDDFIMTLESLTDNTTLNGIDRRINSKLMGVIVKLFHKCSDKTLNHSVDSLYMLVNQINTYLDDSGIDQGGGVIFKNTQFTNQTGTYGIQVEFSDYTNEPLRVHIGRLEESLEENTQGWIAKIRTHVEKLLKKQDT